MLNDETQRVLLHHIYETKNLLDKVVKIYDKSVESYDSKKPLAGAMVFPSLDLGFPNNIQRLAGGFVTGMLVIWKCGMPIVPVDATVNVCSSSVFEINIEELEKKFELVMNKRLSVNEIFNQHWNDFFDFITEIMHKASREKGYSFSFDSGNHFFMIAQDQDEKSENYKKIYLVLHSSANEFKNSYMGLYPVEENWYSKSIKIYSAPDTHGRYLRFIKDKEARYFIDNAHILEQYNIQIHKWLAEKLGFKSTDKEKRNTFHHYYMPTDSSIAIGTYAEEEGETVPIFSNIGKDIYMFKIGKGNWKIHLDNGKKFVLYLMAGDS